MLLQGFGEKGYTMKNTENGWGFGFSGYGAGVQTLGLTQARQVFCHWPASPGQTSNNIYRRKERQPQRQWLQGFLHEVQRLRHQTPWEQKR